MAIVSDIREKRKQGDIPFYVSAALHLCPSNFAVVVGSWWAVVMLVGKNRLETSKTSADARFRGLW